MTKFLAFIAIIFLTGTVVYNICFKRDVASFLSNIAYSYIVAFIFYLVVCIPEWRKNRLLKNVVVIKIENIVHKISILFEILATECKINDITLDNIDNIDNICNSINPHNEAPILEPILEENGNIKVGGKYIWYKYLLKYRSNIKELINEVQTFTFIIEPNIYEALNKLDNSDFFRFGVDTFTVFSNFKNNKTINFLKEDLKDYFKLYCKLVNQIKEIEIKNKLFKKQKNGI